MNEKSQAYPDQENIDGFNVPEDFPHLAKRGAVPGAQPKLLVTFYEGKFYAPGCTPPEIHARWKFCEELAIQLKEKSLESKAGKRSHMTEVEILDQYLYRLIQTRWTSEDEAQWIIRRVAEILAWPVPLPG